MKNTLIISVCSSLFFIIHIELIFSKNTSSDLYNWEIPKTNDPKSIPKTTSAPIIDGKKDDKCWESLEWELLDKVWLGEPYDIKDFAGRYKITWDNEALYVLVQIIDDTLLDLSLIHI